MPYINCSDDAKIVLTEMGERYEELHMDSLADEIKLESFMQNAHRIPLDKFEEFLKTLPQ